MMKKICFILFSMLASHFVFSQWDAGLLVEYRIRFNDDFDRGRKERMHTGFLYVKNNLSRFYMIAGDPYQPADENDRTFSPDTNIQVYTDQAKKIMIAREYSFNGKPYNILDSLYPMSWEITGETRILDSLTLYRAVCFFRGRQYIAWFTPDIPLPLGPWKMGGLPGLIMDLRDSDENFTASFLRMGKQDNTPVLPGNIKCTMAEHIAEMKAFLKRLRDHARTAASGDCITCQTQSKYELVTWEKIPQ